MPESSERGSVILGFPEIEASRTMHLMRALLGRSEIIQQIES
jgi:hypothetical protein